jgi:hypothetical protein
MLALLGILREEWMDAAERVAVNYRGRNFRRKLNLVPHLGHVSNFCCTKQAVVEPMKALAY